MALCRDQEPWQRCQCGAMLVDCHGTPAVQHRKACQDIKLSREQAMWWRFLGRHVAMQVGASPATLCYRSPTAAATMNWQDAVAEVLSWHRVQGGRKHCLPNGASAGCWCRTRTA